MMIKKISSWVGLLLLGASMLAQAASLADFQPDAGLFDSVTLYGGQGADHNLRELPGVIARGDIDWEKSYFLGVGLGKTGPRLGQRALLHISKCQTKLSACCGKLLR